MQAKIILKESWSPEVELVRQCLVSTLADKAEQSKWQFIVSDTGKLTIELVRALHLQVAQAGGQQPTIFVLPNFDQASGVVQNGLLKLLEEPPPRVQYCLLAQSLVPILPTIQSRCQIINLPTETSRSDDFLVELAPETWSTLNASTLNTKLLAVVKSEVDRMSKITGTKITQGQATKKLLQVLAAYYAAAPAPERLEQLQKLAHVNRAQTYLAANVSAKNTLYQLALNLTG